jgi:hypothetical protein
MESVMSTFSLLREAIVQYVDEKTAAGEVVDVNQAAIRLATKYPQTGLTIDEIADEIGRAVAHHAAVQIANRSVGAGHLPETELTSKSDD